MNGVVIITTTVHQMVQHVFHFYVYKKYWYGIKHDCLDHTATNRQYQNTVYLRFSTQQSINNTIYLFS